MGYLGDDFDVTEPADNSAVKQGAKWMRDIKARVKGFVSVLFNPETGEFKDNTIPSTALQNQLGLIPGIYNRVKVNEKGLVESAENDPTSAAIGYYRAIFEIGVSSGVVTYDTPAGVQQEALAVTDYVTHPAGAVNSYGVLAGSTSWAFRFTIPNGVSRVKFTAVGGGGGYDTDGTPDWGGAGAEHVEGTMPVVPGEEINILVGAGGAGGGTGAPGGISQVRWNDTLYAEAAGGGAGGNSSGGVAVVGFDDGVAVIRCEGSAGTQAATGGASGSYLVGYGGGGWSTDGQDGVVILEWVA